MAKTFTDKDLLMLDIVNRRLKRVLPDLIYSSIRDSDLKNTINSLGLGLAVGIVTQDLDGSEYEQFSVELFTPVEADRDYIIYNAMSFNTYYITSATSLNSGPQTMTIAPPQNIAAPSGSYILELSLQAQAENREFKSRMDDLALNLDQLNNTDLPELQNKLDTLDGYLNDPSTIPSNYEFFEGIVTNEIWAGTGVFMEAWADQVFANSVMTDRITANHIDVGSLATFQAFIDTLFANEISLVYDINNNEGGLIRSSNFDGDISPSNIISSTGNAGWAADYNGTFVAHNGTFRGYVEVTGGNAATQTDVSQALTDANTYTDDLETYVNGTFSDGIISEAEAKAIGEHTKTLNSKKTQIDQQYAVIYNDSNLTDNDTTYPDAKLNLSSAKSSFDSAHVTLINTINAAISDGAITPTERSDVEGDFTAYDNTLETLQQRFDEAFAVIRTNKATDAQTTAQDNLAQQFGYTDYSDLVSNAITGNTLIVGGIINTELIDLENLFARNIALKGPDAPLPGGRIQSDVYTAGEGGQGWMVDWDGNAEFHTLTVREGFIGGSEFDGNLIYSDNYEAGGGYLDKVNKNIDVNQPGTVGYAIDKDGDAVFHNLYVRNGNLQSKVSSFVVVEETFTGINPDIVDLTATNGTTILINLDSAAAAELHSIDRNLNGQVLYIINNNHDATLEIVHQSTNGTIANAENKIITPRSANFVLGTPYNYGIAKLIYDNTINRWRVMEATTADVFLIEWTGVANKPFKTINEDTVGDGSGDFTLSADQLQISATLKARWNTASEQRGSEIHGDGLSWDGSKLNVSNVTNAMLQNHDITIFGGTDIDVNGGSSATVDLGGSITINHEDGPLASGNYGGSNNGVVIEDITIDARGHITAVDTVDLDGRYATGDDFDASGTYSNLRAQGTTAADVDLGPSDEVRFNRLRLNGASADSDFPFRVDTTDGVWRIKDDGTTTITNNTFVGGNIKAHDFILDSGL